MGLNISKCVSLNEKQRISLFKEKVKQLKQFKLIYDFRLLGNILKDISEFVDESLSNNFYKPNHHQNLINNILLKENFIETLSNYLMQISIKETLSDEDQWLIVVYLINILLNFSDHNKDIATEILKTKIPTFLIENIIKKELVENLEKKDIASHMSNMIYIVYNIVRWPGNGLWFQNDKLKKTLVSFIQKRGEDYIGIPSMLTLAYLVNENELHLLEEGNNIIKYLIEMIEGHLKGDTEKFCFKASVWEIVDGLKNLSVNDNMKKAIFRENGVQTMINVLKSPTNEKDIEKSLYVLWNLCFDKDIRMEIVNNYNLLNLIKPFQNHRSLYIEKICEGITWQINEIPSIKKKTPCNISDCHTAVKKYKYDFFFSYSWTNKDLIIPITKELKKLKFNFWIDIDEMKGSTLEAMSNGIENSKMFVMAISDAYKRSPTCRSEAEYAYLLEKKIIPIIVEFKYKANGWLGLIIGSNVYYEFSIRREFNDSINGLIKEIRNKNDNVDEDIGNDKVSLIEIDYKDGSKTDSLNYIVDISNWSKENVQIWLIENNLKNIKSKFSTVDGKILKSLMKLQSTSPDYFYQNLKIEMGIKVLDMAKLIHAMDKLKR